MSHATTFIKYWLPLLLWMGVIFCASSDALSSQHTSRFLGPLVQWLFPSLSDESVATAVFYLRKSGHVTEYAVLALIWWRALRRPVRHDPRPWDSKLAKKVVALAALYAASDEFHQFFVPSREARVHDVAIDTIGAAVGLFLLWLLGRWRKT